MDRKLIDKLMIALLAASVMLILAGFLFRLQHWPHGEIIKRTGFVCCFIFGGIEIWRLRRVIRVMEGSSSKGR